MAIDVQHLVVHSVCSNKARRNFLISCGGALNKYSTSNVLLTSLRWCGTKARGVVASSFFFFCKHLLLLWAVSNFYVLFYGTVHLPYKLQ